MAASRKVAAYAPPEQVRIHWVPDGDYSFKPQNGSGRTEQENSMVGVEAIVRCVGG